MELRGTSFILRPWQRGDEHAIVRHANNWNVARNVSDGFPHPYTLENAKRYVERWSGQEPPERVFAIVIDGEAAGSIGIHENGDVLRRTYELGYWLGEVHWGRGVATEAVGLATAYAFEALPTVRLEAFVYAGNAASVRVLEKNGFVCEGRLRNRVFKDGEIMDEFIYAKLRDGV